MPTRPHLVRSIPFWALVAASLATALIGAFLLVDKLGVMTTTLTDGSATGVEVYVGQSIAGLGATLLGAGVVGILIALAVASYATLRPHAPVEVVDPIAPSAHDEHAATPDVAVDEAATTDEAPLPTTR